MNRVTLRLPKEQLEGVEELVDDGHYSSRSSAIRTGIDELISRYSTTRRTATDGGIPKASAPHWYQFEQVDSEPNDWSFRHLEEDVACIENDDHRFVIRTKLVKRERTADRYFTILYESAAVDPLDEDDYSGKRVPFHQSRDASIARNNVSAGRVYVQDRGEYVVVVREDGEETVFDVPSKALADRAADLFVGISLQSDRSISAFTSSKQGWEDHVALKNEVQEASDA